ncbi:DUF378 domain-containing protein [Candidatus Parcubacteria bacterium]|nr:DUF378 domain-containing protein [Candidatus Parcubacteria bacterium]
MKLHKIAFILLIIGGLNWGLTALVSGWDLANYIGDGVAQVVYILVGISALVEVFGHKKNCKECM